MEAKVKKIIKIVLVILLGLAGVGALIWYYLDSVKFMDALDTVSFYLNQPLPIIGISVITLLVFIWKIFEHTAIGQRQLEKFKKENNDLKEEIKKHIDYCE